MTSERVQLAQDDFRFWVNEKKNTQRMQIFQYRDQRDGRNSSDHITGKMTADLESRRLALRLRLVLVHKPAWNPVYGDISEVYLQ